MLLQQNEVTDSAYLGSESTYSECETFTDEDTGALVPPEMHEDVETDSGIEATLHDPEDGGTRSVLFLQSAENCVIVDLYLIKKKKKKRVFMSFFTLRLSCY